MIREPQEAHGRYFSTFTLSRHIFIRRFVELGVFGGCMVAFVEAGATQAFEADVRRSYSAATGIEPEIYPVQAGALKH